jgi:hypothetical protein
MMIMSSYSYSQRQPVLIFFGIDNKTTLFPKLKDNNINILKINYGKYRINQ